MPELGGVPLQRVGPDLQEAFAIAAKNTCSGGHRFYRAVATSREPAFFLRIDPVLKLVAAIKVCQRTSGNDLARRWVPSADASVEDDLRCYGR